MTNISVKNLQWFCRNVRDLHHRKMCLNLLIWPPAKRLECDACSLSFWDMKRSCISATHRWHNRWKPTAHSWCTEMKNISISRPRTHELAKARQLSKMQFVSDGKRVVWIGQLDVCVLGLSNLSTKCDQYCQDKFQVQRGQIILSHDRNALFQF